MNLRTLPSLILLFAGLARVSAGVEQVPLPEQSIPALEALLQQAVRQSPRMVSRAIDLEIAENDRIQARANLLPTAGGSYRDAQSRDDRADQSHAITVRKVYYDFNINQPVFTWGERSSYARMGVIRQKIAQIQYQEAYRILAQEIRARYLSLITQRIYLERSRFNQKLTAEQLRLAEDKYAKKVYSDLDMFVPRLNAERGQIDLERSEFEFENAKHALARLSGVPAIAEDTLPPDVPVPAGYSAAPFDNLVKDFISQKDPPTPEAKSLLRQLEIDQLDYKVQSVRLRPKLSLVAGISQDEQAYSLNVAQKYQVNSKYAGLQVSWAIFDSFSTAAGTRSALARRRQHQNEYTEIQDRLIQQARQQSRQVYFSARNLSIQERYLDSAAGNLRSKQDEFKRGLLSEADVSQVQLNLYDARINTGGARADYYQKVADLLGTLNNDPAITYAPLKP